jgi:hypothetical protein
MADYVLDKGYIWGETTAAQRGRFVRLDPAASSQKVLNTTAAGVAIGVLQESVDAAKAATTKVQVGVRLMGVARVKMASGATGAVARGAAVSCDAAGYGIAAGGAGTKALGIALQTSLAVTDATHVNTYEIDVLLTPNGQVT